jgi:single-stranded DNA-specific DHH superfamily exonuclease
LKKEEIIERTTKPIIDFIRKIKFDKKVIILHDDDCDGICSGAIAALIIKRFVGYTPKLISTEVGVSLTEKVVEKILKEKAEHVIITDVPGIAQNLLDMLRKSTEILIVDHHIPDKYSRVIYCNPRLYDKKALPATYIFYKVYEKLTKKKDVCWIASIGILGDRAIIECSDVIDDIKTFYPKLIGKVGLNYEDLFEKTLLGFLTRIVDSGRVIKANHGAEFVSKTLTRVGYEEMVNGSTKETRTLLKWYKTVRKEFQKLKKDFEKRKKLIGKKILFYEFKSKLRLKSSLASYEGSYHKSHIVLIGQDTGKYFDVSMRRGDKIKDDLYKLIKKAMKNIPNSSGGGHPEAVGGRIPIKYKELFLENLVKNIL